MEGTSLTLRNALRPHTDARLALDRTGDTVSTADQLLFQLDHAMARDAVNAALNMHVLREGIAALDLQAIELSSAAPDRKTYLRRPDLGRVLTPDSLERLRVISLQTNAPDVLFVIADGLSALAVERNAVPLLAAILYRLDRSRWSIAPVAMLTQARVALGDQIGAELQATMAVMLIGERPGLSAPDSLGVYLTWNPAPGRTDAERNCISNIRHGGLSYDEAADRVNALMEQACTRAYTGVLLKESTTPLLNP